MLISKIIVVTGMLTMDLKPLAEQELMIVSADKREVISSCITDAEGNFRCDLKEKNVSFPLHLLAKIRTDSLVTVVYRKLSVENNPVSINLRSSDFLKMTVHPEVFKTDSTYVRFEIKAIKIAGVPSGLSRFLEKSGTKPVLAVFYEHFIPSGNSFIILLKKGSYLICATREKLYDESVISYKRPGGWSNPTTISDTLKSKDKINQANNLALIEGLDYATVHKLQLEFKGLPAKKNKGIYKLILKNNFSVTIRK
ncbi:MAG: hypothetical protein IAF38_14235 [Bacteroidia bacterium]|nr:hypothetical protein [Bacteroidia bacterium]